MVLAGWAASLEYLGTGGIPHTFFSKESMIYAGRWYLVKKFIFLSL